MKLKFVTNRISSIKCFKFEFFSVHCIWYCSECCCCRCCCCRRRRRRRLSQFKTVAADPIPRLSSSSPLPIAAPSGQFQAPAPPSGIPQWRTLLAYYISRSINLRCLPPDTYFISTQIVLRTVEPNFRI